MPSPRRHHLFPAVVLCVAPLLTAAAQSSVAVSPFVSYIPSAATNPLAGFALTFGGTTGLALRSSAEMSISNPARDSLATGGYRPWGADADAMLFLGGIGGGATMFNRALSPYAFAGIGLTGSDSAGRNVVQHGWSYGAGVTLPLGLDASLFGEARWRMSQYVLPTSDGAPDSKMGMRFGLSFHVGGSSAPAPRPRGRRHRMDVADSQGADVEYVVTPAPAAAPNVVVVQPAPAPEPEVIVVEQEAPAREQVVIVEREPAPEPVVIERERATERVVTTRESSPVLRRPPARVTPRRTVIVQSESRTTTRVQGGSASRSSARRPAAVSTGRQSSATTSRPTVQRTTTRVITKAPSTTRSTPQTTTRGTSRVTTRSKSQASSRPAATSSRAKRSVTTKRTGNPD